MPFYSRTKRVLLSAASGPFLPSVGPFATNGLVPISSLRNQNLTSASITSSRSNPYKANTLTITNGGVIQPGGGVPAMFIWANQLLMDFDATINLPVDNGSDGFWDGVSFYAAGSGGSGGSGGGGGSASGDAGGAVLGGDGGNSGGSGSEGVGDDGAASGGGGSGLASAYNSGFFYGSGNDGGMGAFGSAGGLGGNGCGGGGGGGGSDPSGAGGGGGAGGGLCAIVCNKIASLNVASIGQITAQGGLGGGGANSGGGGGDGGSGVVYLATKYWQGDVIFNSVLYIWEITRSGSLIARDFSDSWNNL